MPILQFIPTAQISLHFSVNNKENTYLILPIKIQKNKECVIKDTGKDLFLLEGSIRFYNDHSEISQKLKSDGFIGVMAFHEGIEQDYYILEIHLPEDEYMELVNIISLKNHVHSIRIETPFKDKHLKYANGPDDPQEWYTKEQSWVSVEKCDLYIKFND